MAAVFDHDAVDDANEDSDDDTLPPAASSPEPNVLPISGVLDLISDDLAALGPKKSKSSRSGRMWLKPVTGCDPVHTGTVTPLVERKCV